MREDVTTNRFAAISTSEECVRSRIALNLICLAHSQHRSHSAVRSTASLMGRLGRRTYHEYAHVEFFGHVSQFREKLVELLLSVRELSSASVVDAKAGHDTVDNEKAVFVTGELRGQSVEEL